MSDQLPPHSDEAERGVLACVLLAPENAAAILAKIHSSDFYDLRHQTLFSAIARIIRTGQAPNDILLHQHLKDKGQLQDAGGSEYVIKLSDGTPSAANFDYYLPTLKNKARRRELLILAGKAEEAARNERLDPAALASEFAALSERVALRDLDSRSWLTFHAPKQLREWQPPDGHILVGDCAIVRGGLSVLAGAPGVGKSRGGTALALAGAKGEGSTWFGLPVHVRFKTVIVQAENGRYRLRQEFSEVNDPELDEFVRVSDRPEFGLAFDTADFRRVLSDFIAEFGADCLILDPWNAIARDDAIRDYRAALDNVMGALPRGDAAPAVMIVAHTRKPKGDYRQIGRALLHELSGSYVIGSAARAVFVLQHASDDPADDRVVFTCAKNNDGSLGSPSAWSRRNGLFVPCDDFDWQEFEQPGKGENGTITKEHLETLFEYGKRRLARKHAVTELADVSGLKKTACYTALSPEGRFKGHLQEGTDGLLSWTP